MAERIHICLGFNEPEATLALTAMSGPKHRGNAGCLTLTLHAVTEKAPIKVAASIKHPMLAVENIRRCVFGIPDVEYDAHDIALRLSGGGPLGGLFAWT